MECFLAVGYELLSDLYIKHGLRKMGDKNSFGIASVTVTKEEVKISVIFNLLVKKQTEVTK